MPQYDSAKLFLYRVLPWAPLGDPNAVVNIHWTFQGQGFTKPAWSGRACTSIDECISSITWASRKADTRDIYVCMSTQREFEEKRTGNGGVWRKALREQKNAVQLRALWLDVDVKDGHHADGYDDRGQALTAAFKFVADAGLPRPTMFVTTGSGGLHLYWTLDQAIDQTTWQPLAHALTEATRRFGLKADTQCTVDSARVMRMPETLHSRHGKMAALSLKHVLPYDYSLDQMRHALAPYMGAQVIPLTPRGNNVPGLNSALVGGIERPQAAPINLDTVAAAGCGFVGRALALGGADYANPLWNLTTLVATFTEGGRADAHRMASGHPAYAAPETDDLFDRKLRERDEKDLGWPSCQSVENAGCTSCATCPLKGPSTRPLQFGRPSPPPQAAPQTQNPPGDPLPHGYTRDAKGYVSKVIVAPDGTTRVALVCPYPVIDEWAQDDPWTFNFTTRVGKRKPTISVQYEHCYGDQFGKIIARQGLTMVSEQLKLFREFVLAFTQRLHDIKNAVTAQPFGWVEENGKTLGFAYAARVWSKGGDRPASTPDRTTAKQYTPVGSIDPWIIAAKMITDRGSPGHDAFLASAFAGPLIFFTGHAGVLISTYSVESGVGKSTALKVAQAVWGDIRTAVQSLDDTQNSVVNKIGVLRHLPVYWDELKSEDQTTKFVKLAFQLTQGKEKSRMNADAQQRDPGKWETMLMSASNGSLLDYVNRMTRSTTAGIYRVFEYIMAPMPSAITMSEADQIILPLRGNYGQAGLLYAKWLGENHETIAKEVGTLGAKLEKHLQARNDERFWVAAITTLMLGARYANQLQLTQIDEPALRDHLFKVFGQMRAEVKRAPSDLSNSVSLANIFHDFISAQRARHMLVTDRMTIGPGKPLPVKVIGDTSRIETVRVQWAQDMKRMRVDLTQFREWLYLNKHGDRATVEAMKTKWGVKELNAKIGAGTTFCTEFQAKMIDFDLNDPELKKVMEDL